MSTGNSDAAPLPAPASTDDALHEIDVEDWKQLLAAYREYDEKRELVIKRCRDMQKSSKNAIFALHRGDFKHAEAQLKYARDISQELMPIIETAPALRQGSYGNACEEYAEALTLQVYLLEGRLLQWEEAPWLTCEEYLGGLLDYTGELHRLAVPKAAAHDEATVQKYRDLVQELAVQLSKMQLGQPSLSKKLGPLHSSLLKMEDLLYELSMTRHSVLLAQQLMARTAPPVGFGATSPPHPPPTEGSTDAADEEMA